MTELCGGAKDGEEKSKQVVSWQRLSRLFWSVSGAMQARQKLEHKAQMAVSKERRMPPNYDSATRENLMPEENYSKQLWLFGV